VPSQAEFEVIQRARRIEVREQNPPARQERQTPANASRGARLGEPSDALGCRNRGITGRVPMARFNNKHFGPTLTLTCAAAFLPLLAHADESTFDGRVLAATEAVLDYCAKIDPSAADQYRQQLKVMLHGATDEVLAKARATDDYKQARAAAEDSLSKLDEKDAKETCSQSATPAKQPAPARQSSKPAKQSAVPAK